MVQLFCLSAHRTLLSTSSLPSSLSPSFALTRDSLSVTRPKPSVSSCRASYHAASVAATVSDSKELYLAAAVAAHEHSWSPLFSTTTPAPPSVCSPDTLASCRTASVGVLLSIPDIILAALSWVCSSLSLLVLEIQGPHAAAAYSSKLP